MDSTQIVKALFYAARHARGVAGGLWGRIVLRGLGVDYGRGLVIHSAPFVHRSKGAAILLGNDVTILNTIEENPAGIAHRTTLCASRPGAKLLIGNNVGISGGILVAWQQIEVGDFVNIGAGAAIYDTDFHPLDPQLRFRGPQGTLVAPVCIAPYAWLGARSMVLKGVTIGEAAVVAAGAVVTRDVPPWTVVAGVPARVVATIKKGDHPGFSGSPAGTPV